MWSTTILAVVFLFLFNAVNTLSEFPILIVVSYDGFRYDYFKKNGNPHMVKLRENGTHCKYMRNVFPTKTFPNHHSIATGLYTEKHGVLGNSFFDQKLDKETKFGYDLFHYDEGVVPIWRHNEDQGAGRHSGCMMWPGSSFPYQKKVPTYVKLYDYNFNWHERIDIVLSWIEDPEKPANLVMVYFEQPDSAAHTYGPDSPITFEFLQKVDNITFYLQQQLELRGLLDKVNVVHLSDHGMSGVSTPEIIDIFKYLPPNPRLNLSGSSPILHVIPDSSKKGLVDEYYNILKYASSDNGHFEVYKKEDMPEHWHFKHNDRVPPIFLMASKGYAFQDLKELILNYTKNYNITVTDKSVFGVHGYEPEVEEMRPFFMAYGPQIRVNHEILPFDNVDLFDLFCKLLLIAPTYNDGHFENVRDMLVEYSGTSIPLLIVIVCGGLLVLLLMVCAAAIAIVIIKHQQSITTTAALNKRFPQTFNHSKIEAQHLLEPEEA